MDDLEVFLTDEFPAFLGDVVAGDGVATDAAGEALGVEGAAHHTHRSGLERLAARGTFGKSNLRATTGSFAKLTQSCNKAVLTK